MSTQNKSSLKLELEDLFQRSSVILDYFKGCKSYSAANCDAKYKRFVDLKSKFDDLYARILTFNGSVTDVKDRLNSNVSSFDDLFDAINSKYSDLVSKSSSSQNAQSSSFGHTSLPSLNVPVFDGTIEKWSAFKATYDSVVHSNSSLSHFYKVNL